MYLNLSGEFTYKGWRFFFDPADDRDTIVNTIASQLLDFQRQADVREWPNGISWDEIDEISEALANEHLGEVTIHTHGAKVRGTYLGTPFTGTVESSRPHYWGRYEVTVNTDGLTWDGMPRPRVLVSVNPDGSEYAGSGDTLALA